MLENSNTSPEEDATIEPAAAEETASSAAIQEIIVKIGSDEDLSEEERAQLIQVVQMLGEKASAKESAEGEDPAYSHGTWLAIKETLKNDGIKSIFYSEDNDTLAMLQYGVGNGSGQHLNVVVIYDPEASCVMIRAKYPFYIDRRILPIARTYVCQRCWSMRYTRLEIDEEDGQVVLNTVIPHTSQDDLPEMFELLLHLTPHSAFEEYETLERYSRCELIQEELDAFLGELQSIAPLIQS